MNESISKAMQMITNHDWYWMMCDLGFADEMRNAENHKNQFVALLNTLNNSDVKNTLKELWIANYNYAAKRRCSKDTSDIDKQINSLSSKLNSFSN